MFASSVLQELGEDDGCSVRPARAAFVVFTLPVTDFGAPKVVGGDYDVLATDIYNKVVGQQDFAMGTTISTLLLIPAVAAFAGSHCPTAADGPGNG
jgi:ABC-type Fe3+ transport system permease subunit